MLLRESLPTKMTARRTRARFDDPYLPLRNQAVIRECEERRLSPDCDDYGEDCDDDYPYDTSEEAYD